MIKKLLSLFILQVAAINAVAQSYIMSSSANGNAQYATTCSGTFQDDGGAANYSNGVDASYTFYPGVATQYTRLTFNSFDTQAASDIIYIYDGPGGPLIGSYSGTPGVFTVTASASNSTHGLTVRFHSNGSTTRPGWSATVSCTVTAGAAPAFTPSGQDCEQGGGTTICNNSTFSGNSSGGGSVSDLAGPWDGCLSGENQSSWYYFSPNSAGTVGFTISPNNGTDDYDFALWGPFTSVQCPLNLSVQPLRCSWAAGGGNTGCGNGAVDVSEGAGGDRWVSTFSVLSGEIYVLVIDNYSSTTSPFTLNWNLAGGAGLGCTVLPVEFLSFTGVKQDHTSQLTWTTATENNNAYFAVERSDNGAAFEEIGRVAGSGTTSQMHTYTFNDLTPAEGVNYYRIRQVDFNGQSTVSQVVPLEFVTGQSYLGTVSPNPTTGEFNFTYYSPVKTNLHYAITDVTGRVISETSMEIQPGVTKVESALENCSAGIYFLRVYDDYAQLPQSRQVIKN